MRRIVNGVAVVLDSGSASVSRDGDRYRVTTADGSRSAVVYRDGDEAQISYRGRVYVVKRHLHTEGGAGTGNGELRAPMPGQIVDIRVSVGQTVQAGETVLVLEAMKTQQPILSPFYGSVDELSVEKGNQVSEGALLARIVAAPVPG